jgi:hypothetical protein
LNLKVILNWKRKLTLADKCTVRDQVVDVGFNVNIALSLVSMQILSAPHQGTDILWKEARSDCVDHIKQVFPV